MYIIPINRGTDVILIDPGETDENKLINYLEENLYNPIFVVLTHEHFDHCAAVNILEKYYNFDLIVSDICAKKITTGSGNLSKYADTVCSEFEITKNPIIVHDLQEIVIENIKLLFIETPGHSPGGLCVDINNALFSGDTILDTKVPTNLPGGNKKDLAQSLEKIYNLSSYNKKVYPGHGDAFYLNKTQ